MAVTVTVSQLASELRRQRQERGMKLRDVERESGISAATLSRIERGSTPDVEVIGKLAAWLDVNVVAAGEEVTTIRTDEDLRRAIAVHLRARKNLSDKTARAIVESFDLIMRLEIQKAKREKAQRGGDV